MKWFLAWQIFAELAHLSAFLTSNLAIEEVLEVLKLTRHLIDYAKLLFMT